MEMKNLITPIKQAAKNLYTSHKWSERPESLNLEITSICDSKCIHCPRQDMNRVMRPMPFEMFTRVVDQAAKMKIPAICPNGYGEIMTIKDIDKYLSYIRSADHRFRININTNGFRMNRSKIDVLFKNQVDYLNICLDGATAATAETVRVGLKLNEIESNIHQLLSERSSRNVDYPKLRVGMIKIPENISESESFIKKWDGVADYVGLDGYSNRVGSLDQKYKNENTEEHDTQHQPKACVLPFKEMTLLSDGSVVLCCNDWNGEYVVGNVNNNSLDEIWHSMKLAHVRKMHKNGTGDKIDLCRSCNYWQSPGPFTKLFE